MVRIATRIEALTWQKVMDIMLPWSGTRGSMSMGGLWQIGHCASEEDIQTKGDIDLSSTIGIESKGPNETRCIVRHNAGCYSNLAAAVIYLIPTGLVPESRLQEPTFYAWALKECVTQHSYLAAAIRNPNTNNPEYTRGTQLDLHNHIRLLQLSKLHVKQDSSDHSELDLLNQILERIHNDSSLRFSSVESQPAWALDIVPLLTKNGSDYHRIFISFTYSHSHGDGMSGVVFHQSFCTALQQSLQSDHTLRKLTINCPTSPMPEQPDTSSKMPISLSYLLQPALATYLPEFLARLLGISGDPVTGADNQSWTGSQTFSDTRTPGLKVTTNTEILTIKVSTLAHVIKVCKTHNVKLTALLNHIIGLALKETLTLDLSNTNQLTNLISTVPVNLRRILQVPEATIGNYGGAAYLRYNFETLSQDSSPPWQTLQTQGEHLATVASTLKNQPIGLLRFVSDFPRWITGQIGQRRGCSWELSNLGSFNPGISGDGNSNVPGVRVEQILFSQPACPFGPPFTVNSVALKDGDLNLVTSWQPGALGVSGSGDEVESGSGVGSAEQRDREFIRRIHRNVELQFERVAMMA